EAPLPPGNYAQLAADDKRLYFLERDSAPNSQPQLRTLAIGSAPPKPDVFAGGLAGYALSADGKKVLLRNKPDNSGVGEIQIVDAGAKAPDDLSRAGLRLADWRLPNDPREEWRQMFNDAWRMHREFSFDPAMRGVDWDAVHARYLPLLARVADRNELEDLTGQMTAELGILHSQVRGGDKRHDDEVAKPSALGADLVAVGNGLKIAHIYRSDPELPNERAPLARPGVDAREGDVLTAINGQPVRNRADVAEALANQAGKQVLLTVIRNDESRK